MREIIKWKRLKKFNSDLLFALSVFWFAARVIPKPSRIMYPCQRTTLALIFVRLGVGISTICSTLTKLWEKRLVKVLLVSLLVADLAYPVVLGGYYAVRYFMISPPLLTLADIQVQYSFPTGRIVRIQCNNATNWDFSTGYYWQYVNQSVVDQMVEEGVKELTGENHSQAAWRSILLNYTSGDTVGIKINGNDFWNSRLDEINTIPEVINAVINGVKSIGVPESDIWVIEPSDGRNRYFYQYYYDSINGLYSDVRLLDNDDVSFGSYSELRVSFPYTSDHYITDQMYEIDHLIMIPIMKAITPIWGVTGAIKMMQGNIQSPADFHGTLARTSGDNPNVLMYQNPHVIGKVRLIVGDGLFGAWTGIHFDGGWGGTDTLVLPNHRDDVPNRWITFNNGAPNVLFFGVDPVAIDCVMYDHILAERNAQDQVPEQSLAPLNEPQLIAGDEAGLGIREHGPPYSNIDYVEIKLGTVPSPFHDIAITNIRFSEQTPSVNEEIQIYVTAKNQGDYTETFDLCINYTRLLDPLIGNQTLTLSPGEAITLNFTWMPGMRGRYEIKAYTSIIPDDTNLEDNTKISYLYVSRPTTRGNIGARTTRALITIQSNNENHATVGTSCPEGQ